MPSARFRKDGCISSGYVTGGLTSCCSTGVRRRYLLILCSFLAALASTSVGTPVVPRVNAQPKLLRRATVVDPPCSGCDHVHIFIISGTDPDDFTHIKRVKRYCQALGFPHVQRGHWYDRWRFEREIRCIRQNNPEARFVFVGHSLGANVVRSMAQTLASRDGIEIDLLVYIAGNLLRYGPQDTPANVLKIVHIIPRFTIYRETPTLGADNYLVRKATHYNSPTRPQTLEILARELTEVAGRVAAHEEPVPVPSAPAPP